VTSEVTIDGKYAMVGPDAGTGLMMLSSNVTAPNQALATNFFGTVFGGVPIATVSYIEDPGDVQPIYVNAITASNIVVGITADKNYSIVAIGARP